MPRGIPNAKRDETGMRFTTFNVPLLPNPKHTSTNYLKSESQTLWARKAKAKVAEEVVAPEQSGGRRGSQVIVIHPGSRYLRIGRACDVNPVSVLSVVARKCHSPVPALPWIPGISRPDNRQKASPEKSDMDTEGEGLPPNDSFNDKISAITTSLRDRMRFYKLRITPHATATASSFNKQFKPEIIPEHNDSYHQDWITRPDKDVLIGEDALRLADPQESNFAVKWPIYGTSFNTRDYPSLQYILSDIETLISRTLLERFQISPQDYKNFSVVLVLPDFYDRATVRELVHLLLVSMGFKQLCAQQESLAATYGAGISNACVVDIGAKTTSIACVDEGLVLSDTRMLLNMGGDDITEFLYVLLDRIYFPYRDVDLSRSYDWNIMEELKAKLCTLAEGDVALSLTDFIVRRPNHATEKYGLRVYDEIILAPMCLFEPRVIEFEQKRAGLKQSLQQDVTEEIIEPTNEHLSSAMIISTQHLMPPPLPTDPAGTPRKNQLANGASHTGTSTPSKQDQHDLQGMLTEDSSRPGNSLIDAMEAEFDGKTTGLTPESPSKHSSGNHLATTGYPGGYAIDVCFEASKLPLDVAIFHSARAAGGDEKIRKYLQAVLVIGGTALIPGIGPALESRLQAITAPLVPNMEKVQVIFPPKEVDPRVLAWKGAAVLGKMDGVSELWVTPSDWDILGMRGLKERCFYL